MDINSKLIKFDKFLHRNIGKIVLGGALVGACLLLNPRKMNLGSMVAMGFSSFEGAYEYVKDHAPEPNPNYPSRYKFLKKIVNQLINDNLIRMDNIPESIKEITKIVEIVFPEKKPDLSKWEHEDIAQDIILDQIKKRKWEPWPK